MNNYYSVREELREVIDKAEVGDVIAELLDTHGAPDLIDYLLNALMSQDLPSWWSKLVDILEQVNIADYT